MGSHITTFNKVNNKWNCLQPNDDGATLHMSSTMYWMQMVWATDYSAALLRMLWLCWPTMIDWCCGGERGRPNTSACPNVARHAGLPDRPRRGR